MLPDHNAADLDKLLEYVLFHKSNDALLIQRIQDECFPSKQYREIQHMIEEVHKFNPNILEVLFDDGKPYYVKKGFELNNFLLIGEGFHRVFKNHLNREIQADKDAQLDRNSKQAAIDAVRKADESNRIAKRSNIIAILSAIIALAAMLVTLFVG